MLNVFLAFLFEISSKIDSDLIAFYAVSSIRIIYHFIFPGAIYQPDYNKFNIVMQPVVFFESK